MTPKSMENNLINKLLSNSHRLARLCGFKDLNEIHSEWIRKCWYGPPRRYALQAARGSYKSSSCLIFGTALNAVMRPERKCAVVTKTDTSSVAVLRSISRIIISEAMRYFYAEMGGGDLFFVENTANRVTLNTHRSLAPEPQIAAFGMNGSVTRQHYDDVIVDDAITLADRVSAAERKHTLDFLMEIFNNIAKHNARIVVTGTPWHKDDAWGYISGFCGGVDKWPAAKLPFIPKEKLDLAKRSLPPSLYAINYDLELLKDESLLFFEPERASTPACGEWRPIMHVDAAYGGADANAITITDAKILLGFLRKGHVDNHIAFINDAAKAHGARRGYCEDNADKGYLRKALQQDAIDRGVGVLWRGYHETQNKALKITSTLFPVWRTLKASVDTDAAYLDQILYWSEDAASHDDAPDSASSAIGLLNRQSKAGILPNIGDLYV
jgi:hypothetical protein